MANHPNRTQDYPFIRAWGKMMGSFDYYIQEQVGMARHDRAPETAIFKREDGWATIDSVTDPHTRHYFMVRGLMNPDWTIPKEG